MPHPTDIHVGLKLREARAAKAMSQEELGRKLGISFQQVQKYEKGTNRIGCSRLWEICKHLELPVSYFFDGLDDEVPSQKALPRMTIQRAQAIEGISNENVKKGILGLIKAVSPVQASA